MTAPDDRFDSPRALQKQATIKRRVQVLLVASWACLLLAAGFLAGYSMVPDSPDSQGRLLTSSLILVLIAVALRLMGPPTPKSDPYDPQNWPGEN